MTKNERLQRRFERELIKIDRAVFMKPLEERPQYINYMTGQQMPAHDFNNGGLDIFANYVWPDVMREHATRQLDFEGEIWYQKTRPIEIKTSEQQRLCRPTELKNGVSQTIISNFDNAWEGMRINEIQIELSQMQQ